jgi:ankyrin repeat protein
VARLLLDGGADPDRADSKGNTPLMQAAADGGLAVVQLLLERGAARRGWCCHSAEPPCSVARVSRTGVYHGYLSDVNVDNI